MMVFIEEREGVDQSLGVLVDDADGVLLVMAVARFSFFGDESGTLEADGQVSDIVKVISTQGNSLLLSVRLVVEIVSVGNVLGGKFVGGANDFAYGTLLNAIQESADPFHSQIRLVVEVQHVFDHQVRKTVSN